MQATTLSTVKLGIGTYTSRPDAFFVNSYLIDTGAGIVVIDTQFLISEAQGLREQIKATEKPLVAIFITHPHPDHFNGVGILIEEYPGVPVYATQPTLDGIMAVEAQKREFWTPIHGADYPASTSLPDHILTSGESVTIGEVTFRVEDIGEGETSNMTLVYVPASEVLFAGDLAYHGVHPWLVEAHAQAWLRQLADVRQRYAAVQTVYVGHGIPSTMAILSEQIDYINFFQTLVRQQQFGPDLTIDAAGRDRIVNATIDRYPGWPLESLVAMNIDGVLSEKTMQP